MKEDLEDELLGEKVEKAYEEEWMEKVMENVRKEMDKRMVKLMEGTKVKRGEEMDKEKFKKLISEYKTFKKENVRHFRFRPDTDVFGKSSRKQKKAKNCYKYKWQVPIVSGEEQPESTLQLVQIYFDTATYDEVERDKKIKTEAQLSLIGGTMGLLSGFSIISGIEIIFFIFRLN